VAPADGPLKRPQTLGGLIYLCVLGASVVGLGIVLAGAWRTGLSWIGVALLVAAASRLVLSERRAGMLRVRRRWSDVLMLTVAGVGLIVLTVAVPNQPPT
jgi:multisubunit Na+/H+ antiporter MnhB subunit